MTKISFTVYGKPQPAGSKTGFPLPKKGGGTGVIIVDANPKAKSWQQEVRAAAAAAHDGPLLEGPVELFLLVNLVRPQVHFGTGGNSRKLKPSAPVYPASKPDLLKIARGIEDALTGLIYRDDAQIVIEGLRKV